MAREEISNWTYGNNPSDSSRDAVRYLIGDTNAEDKQLSDCEIQFNIDSEGSVLEAAICAVTSLIAYYARDFDNKSKSMSAQVTENYTNLLKTLKEKRSNNLVPIYSGGLTKSDKANDRENTDAVQPMFTRDIDDNRRDGKEFS
jgi:hypothetical protein